MKHCCHVLQSIFNEPWIFPERPRVPPEQALIKDEKLMHSDPSIRHIALTCPHCGKHYKKVPYDVIKKHQFAFCKQCNKKFRVEPSVLEEALNKAVLALAGQSPEGAELSGTAKEKAADKDGKPASGPDQTAPMHDAQTIAGLHTIVQQAAAAAQDFLPEPSAADEPHGNGLLAKLFDAQVNEADEQPDVTGSFEHTMDKLAAALDETFCQPHKEHPADYAAGVAGENFFSDPMRDRPQVDHVYEKPIAYPAPSSVADFKATEGFSVEDLITYQPGTPAAEKPFEQKSGETSGIRNHAFDAPLHIDTCREITGEPLAENQFVPVSTEPAIEEPHPEETLLQERDIEAPREIPAGQEPGEEPLFENEIIETQAESAPGEEPLDESLIEEPGSGQLMQESSCAIQEQEKTFAATDLDSLASPGTTAANRDVASMLKDIVLPPDDIREGMEQFVLFSLGEQLFAAPVANVAELSLPPDCIMLPNTPQWLLGIANMRGDIISIVDFRGFFGMAQENMKKTSRMIIAQTRDRQMMVGLIVDKINGIHYFATDEILPLQQQAPGQAAAYVSGTCAHENTVAAILDLEQLLQSPKMGQFQ